MTRATPPSPGAARLAVALRELKARTDLSLAGLAERTAYSKSSWDRYLNGGTLPPRRAVQALCGLAGASDERYLALWEIAESEWRGRATRETPAAPDPGPEQPPPAPPEKAPHAALPNPRRQPDPSVPAVPRETTPARHSRTRRAATAVAAVAVAGAVAVGGIAALFAFPVRDADPRSPATPDALAALCQGSACEGRNPLNMHCAARPDTVAAYRAAGGARLEVRLSRECGASWGRMWSTRVGDSLEVTALGRTQSARVADRIDAEAYVYTAILAAAPGTALRACFHPAAGGPAECFDARAAD
ncbi:XRE family transcriptional regulator [Yinghuangia sp. ASG 101]|nr:XRE family transcriptional regulator [Yinghuangia sp. ASG 101]UGQ10435.1 XRE family transcriptional regulator [Yinghuangia sp. ASG 101]